MSQENIPSPYEPEFSIKKLLNDRLADLMYVFQFKKTLLLVLIIGGLAGAFAAWYKAPTYTARLTFVVDDSKASGATGGLSDLAGMVGVNLNGIGGASGVLAGDNIQELIKSHKLIEITLQTAYDSTQTLADRYAAVYRLDHKWLKYSPDGKIIRFPLNGVNNTRLQDSLLHEIRDKILDDEFAIAKPDKKLGFFEINTTMRDEKLAMLFCSRMITQSTEFFITTKTKRLRDNVNRLQKRADSIGKALNLKTYDVAAANKNILDLNPAYTSVNADVDIKDRNKIVSSGIYTETVKNLEASKTMLAQETPTVQIVDEPELPLKKNYLKYYVAIPSAMVLAAILFICVALLTRKSPKPAN